MQRRPFKTRCILAGTALAVLMGCQRPERVDESVEPLAPAAPPVALTPDVVALVPAAPVPGPPKPGANPAESVPLVPPPVPALPAVAASPSLPSAAEPVARPAPNEATLPRPLAPYFENEPARKAFLAGRWQEAAAGFAAISLRGGPDAPRARLLEAVARQQAGEAGAGPQFEALVGSLGPLDATARRLAAEARLAAGQAIEALAVLAPPGLSDSPEAHDALVLKARSLDALGRKPEAADAWRAVIADHDGHDRQSLEAADAILRAGADGDGPAPEREVARILRGVIARSPHSAAAIDAEKRLQALPARLQALTLDELQIRLEAQVERRAVDPATETARQITKSVRRGSDALCRTALLEARLLDKARRRRLLAGRDAGLASACPVDAASKADRRAAAAEIGWLAGKAHRAAGNTTRAIERFGEVAEFDPSSNFSDDALVARAALLRDANRNRAADLALEKAMGLGGDQAESAAFDLFWHRYTSGQADHATAVAKKAVETLPPGALVESRGRLPYWYARSLEERGEVGPATVAYAAVIERYPLGWYAWLATARLDGLDPKALATAQDAARKAPPGATLGAHFADALKIPEVARAVELLRLDLPALGRSGLEAAAAKIPGGDWLRAYVYDQIGDTASAYRIARWQGGDHAATFPIGGTEDRWRLANPRPNAFKATVDAAALAHGVDPAYIWAIMQTESGFRPDVVSVAKAVGLMQLILPTGRAMAKREGVLGTVGFADLKKPDLNIRLGVRYLGRLKERLGGHLALMAAGYNAGPGRPLEWLGRAPEQELDTFVEKIPYRETRRYVKSVMTAYIRYRYLYEGLTPPALLLKLSSS